MLDVPEGYFLAKYYLETKEYGGNLKDAAAAIASEETTGKWVGAGEPTELFKKAGAQVYSVEETAPNCGYATIAFPVANMPVDPYFIPSFWLFMTGGPLYERMFCDTVRLMDFALPPELLEQLPGPKFGMQGVRDLLGLGADDLVTATILKPCAGLTAKEVAEKCYEAAAAGIDFIKDDEKMSNPPYCPLDEKCRLVSEALKRAEDETGKKVLYCPHISTRADQIARMARIAQANGANGLMLNVFAAGWASLQILAEDPYLNMPIYVHTGGRSAWGRNPRFGVDLRVTFRLVRLLGGDFVRADMIDGYLIASPPDEAVALVNLLREPIPGIKDTVPALSGGLGADNLVQNLQAFGVDMLPMSGGAVLGHPMGIRAGVLSLRQAAEAWRKGIPVAEYAKTHPELLAALKKAGKA